MDFNEIKRLLGICCYEDELFTYGFENIAGVDEVGRGSLAGPIVAAAVILDRNKILIENLNDSKKVNEKNRNKLFRKIIKNCKCWSFSRVSPHIIDRISLGKANILVIKKAILRLKIKPDIVITDAIDVKMDRFGIKVIPIISGDKLSASIAAASIVAKVIRDRIMIKQSRVYPGYDFKRNKGYGTKKHILVLQKNGPSKIHRISFKSVLS
ncbi:MAG: ribonuclease HII [Actinobacteria bacterium]|nr:ribonuclease HII [Actinomycetota bacterium]